MREGMKRVVARVVLVAFFSLTLFTCGGGGGGGGTPGGSTSGADTTAPTVSSTSSANGATGVAVNAAISVIFSEAMDASSINAATFTVKAGSTAVPGTVSYSGNTATFTPTDNLAYSTSYTATITTGAKDLAGNALASDYVWSFTTGTSLSSPGIASLRNASAADLANQITRDDASLIQSFEAAQEALARAGIATVDENGVYVAAYLPASPMPDTHPDILALTLEARDRENSYRMTVNELAQSLSDLGWPFLPLPSPGEQLIDFLAAWIIAAGESPSDPQSFTPLFLAEMAKHQIPAVDLSSGNADPSQARLSLLELRLFSAAFDRIMIFPQTPIPPKTGGAHPARLSRTKTIKPLAEEDPCTKYKKIFYGPLDQVLPPALGQQLSDFGITYTVGEALNGAMENMGMKDEFGKAMASVNVLARIAKLIEIYSSLSVEVKLAEGLGAENPMHKPLAGEPDISVVFDAKVGVSDEDWTKYHEKYGELGTAADRMARDCLAKLGIPTFANTGDIAKMVEGFKVEWRLTDGSGVHAHDAPMGEQYGGCSNEPSETQLGRVRCTLQPFSDHSAKTGFIVDVIQSNPPETQAIHQSGVLKSAAVGICAEVDASEAPSLSTFITGAMGGVGIADPIAELAGGMILKLAKPKNCTTLGVTYHEDPCLIQLSPASKRLNGVAAPMAGEVCVDSWSGTFSRTLTFDDGYFISTETLSGTITWGHPVSVADLIIYSMDNASGTITIDRVEGSDCSCHGQLDMGMSEFDGSGIYPTQLVLDTNGSYNAVIGSLPTINMNCSGSKFCILGSGGPRQANYNLWGSTPPGQPWNKLINGRMQGSNVVDWINGSTLTHTWDFGR